MKKTMEKITIRSLVISALMVPAVVLAQGHPPSTSDQFILVIEDIADILFSFLLILAVVFIVISAYYYLTSQGNSEKVQKAHATLIYALVAVAVGLIAFSLVEFVQKIILIFYKASVNNKKVAEKSMHSTMIYVYEPKCSCKKVEKNLDKSSN